MLLVSAHLDLDHHDTGEWHPESRERLAVSVDALAEFNRAGAIQWMEPRSATLAELSVAHDASYLHGLAGLCSAGGGELDPDTPLSAGSWSTACVTAGAGLQALDQLEAGQGGAAFILGRPPGHHAASDRGMGFCLINNAAVAAATLARRGERVAIIDWDVHHGNGTQEIFWSDPSVLYISIHQRPLYPGTGSAQERGGGAGLGTTMNLPMPAGTTGDSYLSLFDGVIIPALERFAPGWVFVSAGFDAHRADPLAGMCLTAGDYAKFTHRVMSTARASRLVLFLEGGYELAALRMSVVACAAELLSTPATTEKPSSGGAGMLVAAQYERRYREEGGFS